MPKAHSLHLAAGEVCLQEPTRKEIGTNNNASSLLAEHILVATNLLVVFEDSTLQAWSDDLLAVRGGGL
jgi:hypothetical protein